MPGYIFNVCTRYKHLMHTKCKLSPHKHCKVIFCQTTQLTHINPYSPPLSKEGVKRIQGIIVALLYYARAVDNKLLATLSTLNSQQASATEATNFAINQLLDYLATYPKDGTTYCVSNMILCAHADAGFHNESKGRSQADAHICISKNNPFPKHNGQVLSISQIMKFVMSSATEAKLGALYTTAKDKEMVPFCQTLIKMGCPQPHTPIQMDNSTAVGVTNLAIILQKTRSPCTSVYSGSAAKSLTNSSVITGIKAATIGQTTTPNTTNPSTTRPTDPSMPVQLAYYPKCCTIQAPLRFPTNKPTITPFFSLSDYNLGCHCKGVLFTYYLHMVRTFTKLVTLF
jgi:hypothetical protein